MDKGWVQVNGQTYECRDVTDSASAGRLLDRLMPVPDGVDGRQLISVVINGQSTQIGVRPALVSSAAAWFGGSGGPGILPQI